MGKQEDVRHAYGRVRQIRTLSDATLVRGSPTLVLVSFAVKDKLSAVSLPEWECLPEDLRRFLELAHLLDVLDDSELNKRQETFSETEKGILKELAALSQGETVENLLRQFGLSKFDPAAYERIAMVDVLDWLKSNAVRDPAIWHEMPWLNWDYSAEMYSILRWVVDQPECDAATAVDILYLMGVDTTMDIASGGTKWLFNQTSSDPFLSEEVQLLKTICLRSDAGTFAGPALKQKWDATGSTNLALLAMMKNVLAEIEAAGRKVPFPLPERLLSRPIPQDLPDTIPPVTANDDVVWVPRRGVR